MQEHAKGSWVPILWGLLCVAIVGSIVGSIYVLMSSDSVTAANSGSINSSEYELPSNYVPDFSLVDSDGQRVTREDVKGKLLVVDFFYTSCPTLCPMLTKRMKQVQSNLPDDGNILLLSISVDPDKDTPKKLKEYAETFGADQEKWRFLTGDKDAIISLCRDGFKLSASMDPQDHSARVSLVGRDGLILGYYDSQNPSSMDELRRELKRIVREESK